MDKAKVQTKKIAAVLLLTLFLVSPTIFAQKASLKANLLYNATTTPNLAFEIGLSNKTSLELSAGYNPWEFSNNKKLMPRDRSISRELQKRVILIPREQKHSASVPKYLLPPHPTLLKNGYQKLTLLFLTEPAICPKAWF